MHKFGLFDYQPHFLLSQIFFLILANGSTNNLERLVMSALVWSELQWTSSVEQIFAR